MRRSFWRRHRLLKWIAAGLLVFLAIFGIVAGVAVRHAEPFLRALIVERLEERFHARVELDSFHVSLAQGLRAQGKGLRIWPPAQVEGVAVAVSGKPLIELAEFHFRAPLHFERGKPIHIWTVELRGLKVDVPPKPRVVHERPSIQPSTEAAPAPLLKGAELLQFQIDSVQCRDAVLMLENSNPAKQPLEFDIQTIKVARVRADGTMGFEAVLTNPRPRGLIATKGSFGPWALDDPGETPIAGVYRFEHADLGVFKGIAGTLSSTGRYQGVLRDMTVDGQADTPNFSLAHFGAALPLRTTFHARVDGTSGDTWLEPVKATLGKTAFTARGKIVQQPPTMVQKGGRAVQLHPGGHEVLLDVDVEQGEIADFLRLASRNGDSLLTGTLHMKTTFELPPGTEVVHDRMRLNGSFRLDDARFTSAKVQDRISDLSLRSQGKANEAKSATPDVSSTMEGDFTMQGGAVTLPHLVYLVPGTEIDLSGTYGLEGGTLAFRGTARMRATVSEMVGGWKGLLLKPADRLFKKDGAGTKVRVHIYGTREDPHFGVDLTRQRSGAL